MCELIERSWVYILILRRQYLIDINDNHQFQWLSIIMSYCNIIFSNNY